ncbi:MAG: hypothetical protein AABY64_04590 [Bdellovibrionota bacterium]
MKTNLSSYFIFLFLLLMTANTQGAGKVGFDKAKFKKSVSLAESQFAYNESVKQNCYVFSQHAVIEYVDPGLTGSKISIRPKDTLMTSDEICSEKYKGRQLFLNNKATYFWGSFKNFLFVRAADDFSDRERFEVFDTLTGENLWNAHRNNGKNFILKMKAGKISLTYNHHLKIFCDITLDKRNNCWKRVYLDYKIPEDIPVAHPDCRSVLKKANLSPKSQVYVFLPVTISDLKKPKIKYLPGSAICSVAP